MVFCFSKGTESPWRPDLADGYHEGMNVNPYESPRETEIQLPSGRSWSYWIRDTTALFATVLILPPVVAILAVLVLGPLELIYHWLVK